MPDRTALSLAAATASWSSCSIDIQGGGRRRSPRDLHCPPNCARCPLLELKPVFSLLCANPGGKIAKRPSAFKLGDFLNKEDFKVQDSKIFIARRCLVVMKVFHGLVVTWCLLLAVSLATEVEETVEMGSMAGTEAKKLYNGLPKQDLPVVVQKGISAMDQYDAENGEMMTMNKKLIKRLSAPWKTKIGAC